MGIVNRIKSIAASSGGSKEKILYVRSDSKVRVRFLQELDDGYEFKFHDSFADGINTVCREEFGDDCPLCGNDNLRTRSLFAWSVWNYETKQVEIALFPYNRISPVAALLNMSEVYNTIMDRDYVICKEGKQLDTKFTVVAMDRAKFRNEKAKPFTREAILKMLDKAFPFNELNKEEDEEEKKSPLKKSKKVKEVDEDDFDDLDENDDDEKYNKIDIDDDELFGKKTKKRTNKNETFALEDAEEMLEDEDIDEDDFCEYFEVASVKKMIKDKTKKQFKKMIDEYLESFDDDDEE